MAEGDSYDINIKCGICLSDYSEPRILNCFHKFCTSCLEKIIDGKSIFECPLCHTDVLVPTGGVVNFNLYPKTVESNLETLSNDCGTFCQICDIHSYAVVKCLNCDQFLCGKCYEYHTKVKLLRDHEYDYLRQVEFVETEKVRKEDDGPNDCNIHKKELNSFCKPCNELICSECQILHNKHDVANISRLASIERNLLNAAIGSLKARIPILEKIVQTGKIEENTYYKNSMNLKEEIKSHAEGLKEVFCKTVDIVTNNNLESIDKFITPDIKHIESCVEEIETEKHALASMVTTTEEIIKSSCDRKIMKICSNLKRRFNRTLQTPSKVLKLFDLQYTPKDLGKQQIEEVAGKVKRIEREVKPCFRNFPIPDLRIVKEFKQISYMSISGVFDLVPGNNATCWILSSSSNMPLRYSLDGKKQKLKAKTVVLDTNSRLLKKTDGDIFVWSQMSAFQISPRQTADENKQFQVDFDNGIPVCFLKNRNLLIYNPSEKIFVEVGERDGIKSNVHNKLLSGILDNGLLRAIQTKAGNLIIVQNTDKVLTVNDKFEIVNTASIPNSCLRDICVDKYENIFVADYRGNKICLFSPEGVYQGTVHNITNPNNVTVDDCGNLWISESFYNNLKIYSYL